MKEENNFGVPKVDNSPMGIIGMEGNLLRGIMGGKKERPTWVRIIAIFLSSFFLFVGLIILGSLVYSVAHFAGKSIELFGIIIPVLFGILFTGAGFSGIISNIKKQK